MLKRLLALVAFSLLAVPAAEAGAADEQLDPAGSFSVTATPGWVSWKHDSGDGWVVRHDDAYVTLPQVFARTLGTDAKGRAVALDRPCDTCRTVERRLSDGSVRALPRRAVSAADEARGTLAYGRADSGIYVLRSGARHAVRVSRTVPRELALGRRWLVYWSFNRYREVDIRAIDLSRSKPRERLLVHDPRVDEECGCTSSYRNELAPTVDGHFAYWVERVVTYVEPRGTANSDDGILRVDLNAKRPVIERFDASGSADSLAVSGGTLFYGGQVGVFRVTKPTWQKTSYRLPLQI